MKLKKLLHHLTKTETIILAFLVLIFAVSAFQVAGAFYEENSKPNYLTGGVYVEGSVGQVNNLNPLFVQQGSVSQDLSQLIFSGLTKYDTKTGEIVADLANVKSEPDGKKFTFVIKDGAKWHDGKPVTANDVTFTYNDVIKNPEFKGVIQNYNDYSGIKINKVDDRTVEFLLEKPDSFFLVKTMVGILPKHLLEKEKVSLLETAPFNFSPIGSGPYKFVSQTQSTDHLEYGFEAFKDFYDGPPNIDSIVMKVFDTYENLQKNAGSLNGIRTIPNEKVEDALKNDFTLDRYELPQYVGIFMNNEAPKLKNASIRLALQLGTDRQALADMAGQTKIIDTPLLEIHQDNWVNHYSILKANGALFGTEWQIPNKDSVIKQTPPPAQPVKDIKPSPTAEVTYINSPNEGKDWTTAQDPITIAGTVPVGTKSVMVNDYELQKFTAGDSGWTYAASTKFDSLKEGQNVYEVYATDMAGKKKLIDAITIQFNPPKKTVATVDSTEKLEAENAEATVLPIRKNSKGEALSLRLITSSKPEIYQKLALEVKKEWQKIGVDVKVEVLENDAFQVRVNKRDYDLLIFGQSLGYNLDAYPYWHSSQAKEGGLNLSQFKNFVVDSLLEKARLEDEAGRKKTLNDIQAIISREIPAIFLYSPTYFSGITKNVYHPPFDHLSTTSDRLSDIAKWYAKVQHKLTTSLLSFFPWVMKQF